MTPHAARHHRFGALATLMFVAAAGCASHISPPRPLPAVGQIADDYRLHPSRALVVARIGVTTDGKPGLGPIGNPLFVQFDGRGGSAGDSPHDHSSADPQHRIVANGAHRPARWEYVPPGLLVMAVPPGTYDTMVIAYPDMSHLDRPIESVHSIPAPNRAMQFASVQVAPGTVTYLGDIEITQTFGWVDLVLNRINVDYAVIDRYDQTVDAFRARYRQFEDAAIGKQLAVPTENGA